MFLNHTGVSSPAIALLKTFKCDDRSDESQAAAVFVYQSKFSEPSLQEFF